MTETPNKNAKKIIPVAVFLPIIAFILLVIVIPRVNNFMQKDACLDAGGSYNEVTKTCDKGDTKTNSEGKKDPESNTEGQNENAEGQQKDACLDAGGSFNEQTKTCEKEQEFLQSLTYSNLTDKPSQEEVKMALQKAGIDEKNISHFFGSVDFYNKSIENTTLNSGFTKIDKLEPKYDMGKISEKWENKNPDFPGYNCRITSYTLMKNFIKIAHPEKQNDKDLFVDKESLDKDHQKIFNDGEKEIFKSFYSRIPTTLTRDLSIHIEKVKKDWQEKGITFPFKGDKTKASLISVFFHNYFDDEDNFLFIGHIGVLVPTEDNKILFVEKISFEDPYQVFKFNNRTELNDYLMNKYDTEYNQPTASPFIFENNELLEGYRANLNKKKS